MQPPHPGPIIPLLPFGNKQGAKNKAAYYQPVVNRSIVMNFIPYQLVAWLLAA
jgi:hypothetical protein